MGKKIKINSTGMIALGFLITILIGTVLLKLPIAHIRELSWFNSLFISTSATCTVGLTPITLTEGFTLFGQIILLILIQVGGLRFYANNCIAFISAWREIYFKR